MSILLSIGVAKVVISCKDFSILLKHLFLTGLEKMPATHGLWSDFHLQLFLVTFIFMYMMILSEHCSIR